jgi:hypothetical protein
VPLVLIALKIRWSRGRPASVSTTITTSFRDDRAEIPSSCSGDTPSLTECFLQSRIARTTSRRRSWTLLPPLERLTIIYHVFLVMQCCVTTMNNSAHDGSLIRARNPPTLGSPGCELRLVADEVKEAYCACSGVHPSHNYSTFRL